MSSSRNSHTSGTSTYDSERVTAIEEAIGAQLKELDLVRARHREVAVEDERELDAVDDEITNIIQGDRDGSRRAKLLDLVGESMTMRRLILYLRRLHEGAPSPPQYYETAMNALEKVTDRTYDGEYRKAALVLGVVEAGAELLVLEVEVWGAAASMQPEFMNGQGRNERRDVRKQIASVLTNLTFGSSSTKRQLAEYAGFLTVVVQIIGAAPNLVPSYSNLLRNVSWPSCKGMPAIFAVTPALARAAVEAHRRNGREDDKSVKSSLSAIWNIVGSGGEDCVRAVVEEEGCVEMLIGLLTQDAHRTLVVEYSTGILKYAAAELVRADKFVYCGEVRARLVAALLPLLRSSSITIVKNALTAVNEIAAKDAQTVANVMTSLVLDSLEKLQRASDNEIRRHTKAILARIGAGDSSSGSHGAMMSRSAHVGNGRDMSSSLRADRLLPRRSSPFCSPAHGPAVPCGLPPSLLQNGGGGGQNGEACSSHRASSLPRHFTPINESGGRGAAGGGMSTSLYGGPSALPGASQYAMDSPSPLYGNMDTIRAAAAQQQQQQAMQQQQPKPRPIMQHPLQQRHQVPPNFPAPAVRGGAAAAPLGFPTSFAPPPGAAAAAAAVPPSFPSTSFAPAPSAAAATAAATPGASTVFGAEGPATLKYEESGAGGYEDDDEISNKSTRADSALSLADEMETMSMRDVSGFQSTVETANNSCRLSPVSYSELPDSPTQCAAIRDAAAAAAVQLHLPSFPLPSFLAPFGVGAAGGSGGGSSSAGEGSGLSSSHTRSSHTTTPHATSAEQTPTFATLNAPYGRPAGSELQPAATAEAADSAPSTSRAKETEEEDDYGVYGEDDLLDRSIQEALPARVEEKRERLNSFLLDSLSSALPSSSSHLSSPSSKGSSRYSNTSTLREDDLLAAAIESAMPKVGSLSSPRGTLQLSQQQQQQSKNGRARWSKEERRASATEGLHASTQLQQRRRGEESESDSSSSSSSSSEDEAARSAMGGSLVGTMPRDVEEEIEAERIAIDCSSLRRKPRPPRQGSHLPRTSLLATPSSSSRQPRQATPLSQQQPQLSNGRPSPRPSSIGRPRPLTSTPVNSKSRLAKFPATPRVWAIALTPRGGGTANGNTASSASNGRATPPPLSAPFASPPTTMANGRGATPPTGASSASSSSVQTTPTSMGGSRLKKPTASAVVPPYNYQKPTPTTAREEKRGTPPKGATEPDAKNGQMLVTTV